MSPLVDSLCWERLRPRAQRVHLPYGVGSIAHDSANASWLTPVLPRIPGAFCRVYRLFLFLCRKTGHGATSMISLRLGKGDRQAAKAVIPQGEPPNSIRHCGSERLLPVTDHVTCQAIGVEGEACSNLSTRIRNLKSLAPNFTVRHGRCRLKL